MSDSFGLKNGVNGLLGQIDGMEIINLANQMRKALETIALTMAPAPFPPCWHIFPKACCGDTSNLLAAYLADHGFRDFTYVMGYFKKSGGPSHAWLEGHGLVIDITGDQFADRVSDAPQPVCVSTKRAWHDQYFVDQDPQGEANFKMHSSPYLPLYDMYSRLQPYLNNLTVTPPTRNDMDKKQIETITAQAKADFATGNLVGHVMVKQVADELHLRCTFCQAEEVVKNFGNGDRPQKFTYMPIMMSCQEYVKCEVCGKVHDRIVPGAM